MKDNPEQPEWLKAGNEGELRAAIRFTDPHQPGVACELCSAMVPMNFIFGKTIYYPAGRHEHV